MHNLKNIGHRNKFNRFWWWWWNISSFVKMCSGYFIFRRKNGMVFFFYFNRKLSCGSIFNLLNFVEGFWVPNERKCLIFVRAARWLTVSLTNCTIVYIICARNFLSINQTNSWWPVADWKIYKPFVFVQKIRHLVTQHSFKQHKAHFMIHSFGIKTKLHVLHVIKILKVYLP